MLRVVFSICCFAIIAAPLRAGLAWEKSAQNFHRAPGDGHLETKFVFRNDGKAPVTIRKVRT